MTFLIFESIMVLYQYKVKGMESLHILILRWQGHEHDRSFLLDMKQKLVAFRNLDRRSTATLTPSHPILIHKSLHPAHQILLM